MDKSRKPSTPQPRKDTAQAIFPDGSIPTPAYPKIKCYVCQEMAPTNITVLVDGILPVHRACLQNLFPGKKYTRNQYGLTTRPPEKKSHTCPNCKSTFQGD